MSSVSSEVLSAAELSLPLSLAVVLSGLLKVLIAVAIGLAILWLGLTLLRIFAQKPPPPPPPGKMRKVRLNYRCSICGAEVRMTSAPYEIPDPPRHCGDDMTLITPTED